ncbi:NfeD family protein [Catellatospora sp. KI3]|uniref:NfeD family protein n=1 Tax=Catellatospora sp. KI3 TaxID=3041620 RepID=UPI002483240F|nr:NfeD family protein [Catellatospora sp. KI3]MDI1465769.1 NfeD family protein [Catellatospora sp. KI3]
MEDWMWWLLLAAALVIAELFTMTFVLLMIAAGAFAASLTGLVGLQGWVQGIVFIVVSTLSLVVVRPWLKTRWFRGDADNVTMGLSAIEGADALVVERVDSENGLVKIGGELWRARPYDGTKSYVPGDRVRVVKVDGATALVWRD